MKFYWGPPQIAARPFDRDPDRGLFFNNHRVVGVRHGEKSTAALSRSCYGKLNDDERGYPPRSQ